MCQASSAALGCRDGLTSPFSPSPQSRSSSSESGDILLCTHRFLHFPKLAKGLQKQTETYHWRTKLEENRHFFSQASPRVSAYSLVTYNKYKMAFLRTRCVQKIQVECALPSGKKE